DSRWIGTADSKDCRWPCGRHFSPLATRPRPARLTRPAGASETQRLADTLVGAVVPGLGGEPDSRPLSGPPVGQREIERLHRHARSLRERGCAAVEEQLIADAKHALGGDGGGIVGRHAASAGEVQGVGAKLVAAQAPERHEQFIASHPPEAWERESLEQPLEAALGTPRRI